MNQRSANAKLTDVEYDLIKGMLPCGYYKGRKRPDNRLFIDAVLYVAKAGLGQPKDILKDMKDGFNTIKEFGKKDEE